MAKGKKKCPICGKPYYDYIKHIWTHKTKTVKWLQERRKNAPKKPTSKKHGDKSVNGVIFKIRRLLNEIE